MALKSTSSPLTISDSIAITTTGATDFITEQIDLQLNPLDNEVFVVTAVKIDFGNLPTPDFAPGGIQKCNFEVSVCKARPATSQDIGNSNVIATSRINSFSQSDAGPPVVLNTYFAQETNAMDTPPASQDYLDIVATDNMFLSFLTNGDLSAGQTVRAAVRVHGYRARADAATYAALVQSEVLSAN